MIEFSLEAGDLDVTFVLTLMVALSAAVLLAVVLHFTRDPSS